MPLGDPAVRAELLKELYGRLRSARNATEAEPIADERQQDRDDRVDQEATDEDPIVVNPIQLRPDGTEHGIEGREDRHRRVPAELETDVDVEDESRQDAHEEPEQGDQHVVSDLA